MLPEKWTVLGRSEVMEQHARRSEGPAVEWARRIAAELQIDLIAGSFVERRPGQPKTSNTSLHVGPDGEIRAEYRKLHMFDVEVENQAVYSESAREQAGDEIVVTSVARRWRRRPPARDGHLLRRPLPRAVPRAQTSEEREILTVTGRLPRLRPHDAPFPLGGAAARARAIEKPMLRGSRPTRSRSYQPTVSRASFAAPRSIDPWGILAGDHPQGQTGSRTIVAELDFTAARRALRRAPSRHSTHRRDPKTSTIAVLQAAPERTAE